LLIAIELGEPIDFTSNDFIDPVNGLSKSDKFLSFYIKQERGIQGIICYYLFLIMNSMQSMME
jgi:hypothetical protein